MAEGGKEQSDHLTPAFLVLAGLTAAAGLVRVIASDSIFRRLDETTLTYFLVAGAMLLLRHVK